MMGDGDLLSAAADATPDLVCVCTPAGEVVRANDAASEAFFFGRDPPDGAEIWDCLAESESVRVAFSEALAGESPATAHATTDDGATYEFSVSMLDPSAAESVDRPDGDGRLVACIGRRRGAEVPVASDPGGHALDRITDGFQTLDEDWRLTYVNEPAREVLNEAAGLDLTAEEWLGRVIWDVIPEVVDTRFYHEYHEAMETQEPVAFEEHFEPLSSWFEVRAFPSPEGLSVYFRDVTEQVTQREALAERERVLREVYEVVSDTDRSFEEQVDALLTLGREVVGTEHAALSRVRDGEYVFESVQGPAGADRPDPGDRVPLSETFCERAVVTEETLVLGDAESEAPDLADRAPESGGARCYLGAPVVVDGEVYGTFCFYDPDPRSEPFSEWAVTVVDLLSRWIGYELERRERTEQLRRQNDRLEQVVSVLSHDLRNPLNVAIAQLELLDDGQDVDTALGALERMADLIDDTLTMAREGERVTDTTEVRLSTVAHAAWSTVRTPEESLVVADDATFAADESRLAQVFENLFRNAVEHGSRASQAEAPDDADRASSATPAVPDAAERGSTVPETDGADGAAAEPLTVTVGALPDGFYVADDGTGFGDVDPEEAFEAGFTTNRRGTGFGLAIVSQVADAHGWTVEAMEGEDGGARFEFTDVDGLTPVEDG